MHRKTSIPFKAQYTKQQVLQREEIIIKYIVSLIRDINAMPDIIPYFLEYGILDWSWPLRFVKGNQMYKGYKYYSQEAYRAILNGERKFKRDHIFPKKKLKRMLLNDENHTALSIRQLMEKYGEVCVVTIYEDRKLNSAGLCEEMPQGWQIGDEILERYQNVGIVIWENDQQW